MRGLPEIRIKYKKLVKEGSCVHEIEHGELLAGIALISSENRRYVAAANASDT
jgi:hypothetical protein